MTDHLDEQSIDSTFLSSRNHSNIDNTPISNIPIPDFRQNEARPILTDNGY